MGIRQYLAATLMFSMITWLAAQSAPVPGYDYHIPANAVSPITLGMGGINLTNSADYFSSYDNPALLADNVSTAFATSFRLKNDDYMTFAEAMNASNLLKPKQFMYFTLITKSAAWSYQPVSSIHISEFYNPPGSSVKHRRYFDYQLDKLQVSFAAKDEKYASLSGGFNLKYLTGRLIKLEEKFTNPTTTVTLAPLVDDKVKGVSGDLGLTMASDKYTVGFCVYDLYSRLWWENFDAKSLQRRTAIGFQYKVDDNFSLMASTQGKISKYPGTTYHFGLIKNWTWGSEGNGMDKQETTQNLVVRAGLFSKDFNGTENINFTLGSGYNYNMFRVDFALTNNGMELKDSQYLFSVGLGIQ